MLRKSLLIFAVLCTAILIGCSKTETTENSNAGGTLNSVATTFRLGDDAGKRQYRGVLSFNTGASIPDDAIIIDGVNYYFTCTVQFH